MFIVGWVYQVPSYTYPLHIRPGILPTPPVVTLSGGHVLLASGQVECFLVAGMVSCQSVVPQTVHKDMF